MHHFRSMEGTVYRLGRITIAFKSGDGIDPAHGVLEEQDEPGATASLHRHPGYVETFLVCEGRYEFRVGDDTRTVGAGEVVAVPRGAPHAFTSLGPATGRMLVVSSPGGHFEAFIREVSAAPREEFAAVAARHGIEFL